MKPVKVLALVCGILLLMLVGGLVGVWYFFPAEAARQHLEQVLSQQLQANVRVASLEWDLWSGIRLGGVEIERNDVRFARFDDLVLRYSLRHLVGGELFINELVLRGANVLVDLRGLPTKADMEPAAEPRPPAAIPSLPFTVKIEAMGIQDSLVTVTGDEGFRLVLHEVNLIAGLSAGPRRADVSGILDVADVEAALNEHQWRLPLHVKFGVTADLSKERLIVEQLDIRSDPVMSLFMKGRIDHVASSKDMSFSIHEGKIDLEHLVSLGKRFLPAQLADMRLAGTIAPKVTVTGSQAKEGFNGTVEVDLRGTEISGSIPALGVALEPTAFHLRTGEIPVRTNLMRAIRADLSLTSAGATMRTISLHDLDLQVGANHGESGQFSSHLTATADLSAPPSSGIHPLSEPVEVEIEASGDTTKGSISLSKMEARIGKLLAIESSGQVEAEEGTTAERAFTVKAVVATDVTRILPVFPQATAQGLALASASDRQKLILNMTGKLDMEYRPQWADVMGELDMSGLRASLARLDIRGTLDRLHVEMQARYQAQTGILTGTIAGVAGAANLMRGTSLGLEQAHLKLRSDLSASLSPELAVRQLRAVNRIDLETRRARYAGAGMTGQLERLTVSASTKADVLKGTYVLDSLRLAAGGLLDMTGKGEYQSKSGQFSVDASVPSFNVAELRKHLSGTEVQALSEIHPTGHMSMHIRGFGALPGPEQIAALEIPVTLFMNLDLHDVAGAFRDHAVTGANGTVRISAEPKPRHRLVASWRLQAKRLDVGGGLPIKPLNDFSTDAEVSAEDFDSITFDRFRVGANGVNVMLEGELSGVKRILARKEKRPLALLGPLFIKMRSDIALDLNRFADVAQSYGITGSGRAGFSVSLFKKERGPLDMRLRVLPRGLSLTKDTTHVEDLDGTIAARKTLQWIPGLDGAFPDAAFTPTGVLPELRASTPSRPDLRIRQFETWGIQVRNLSASLFFDQNRFVAQDLAMTVLDGGLGGEVVLTGGKAFSLAIRLEATRLDVNRLLPPEEQVTGDSLIDGTVNLTAAFEPDQGRLDFGRSKLNLYLTRIGRETLSRVLRFLDPKGSNPSIVGARSAAQLANPSAARVTLLKGQVGLQIDFQDGLLARFEMDRIPVSQIKHMQDLTQTIPQWAVIRRVMELLGADQYGVDQAGAFVLQ